ncbi:complement factor H-related protein 5 isoform X2 [Nannospalax galili]|uniref:complement factor H-related protein 5 isoform X2 n=1 Tax=Nannospalax galili TaxID=1026970 RepID=UPI00111C4E8A|nr:complement factor H-related protein 5 isoform X2 [Nannospalax galili]
MLLLVNVILTLWISTIGGQEKVCDFPKISHGILYDEKKYKPLFPVPNGTFFYYSCGYNFVSPSNSFWTRIICTKTGWTPTPKCLRQTLLQGDIVQIVCNKGYSLQNNQSTITCTEGGWSTPPRCISTRKCLKSDIVIDNGFLSEVEHTYAFNKETQYKCKPGYMTADGKASGTVKCLQDGWSTQPICIKSCDMPVLVNARHRGNRTWYKLKEKLEYECEDGYDFGGGHTTGSTECGEHGWSHLPMCYEKECPVPVLDANVNAHPKQEKYKLGDLMKFSCRRRLTRVGPNSVQCYQFGWSPHFPTCKEQVQSCGLPPQLPSGKVKEIQKEEYKHGEIVEYDCNPNFIMKGPKKIQCMDAEWTSLPTCVEQLKTCGYLPELKHGYVLHPAPSYQHGVSVVLTCKKTYTMIGNNTVTCISGTWTEFPTCVATHELRKCERSKLGTRTVIRPHLTEFNHNARINYKCSGTYKYKQTVCINGKWEPEPDCIEKKTELCPPPPQIPNAQNMVTTVNYQDGETVAVLCKENYLLSEAKDIVCKNGHWQSLPQCIESEGFCGPPPPINNGDIISFQLWAYPSGSTVDYSCQAFYKPQGSTKVICQNGQWSDPPKCLDACVILEEVMEKNNIQLKWTNNKKLYVKTGDTVEFECKLKYKAKTPLHSFRTTCNEGEFQYPVCE